MMRTSFLVFILLASFAQIIAQNKNYFFKHLDTRDGLSGEEAIGFTQDNKGFIWIATTNGLQRYDGENFITYRHNSADTNSLSADETFIPIFDKQNNLWLEDPEHGINLFNITSGCAIKLELPANYKENENDHFISFCKDEKGDMWLSSLRALYCYHYTTKQIEKVALFPDSLINHNIQAMECDRLTGNIWISTRFRIIEYNRKGNIFFDFHNNPEHEPLFNLQSEPNHIFVDSRHNLWFSTWQGELFRYNLSQHILKQFYYTSSRKSNTENLVGGIIEDKNGDIWIGANSSDIFFYNSLKDSLQLAARHFIEIPSIAQTDINSMFCDRENNIWIGTSFGAYYFNPTKQKIYAVSNNSFDHFSLPASQVETFGESSDGLIWVSSRNAGGLSVFDKQMNLVKRLFYRGDPKFKNIHGIEVTACCSDSNGKFWMSAFKTLIRYDPASKQIKTWISPEINFRVHAMICDEDNIIWIGGGKSLIKLNPLSNSKKLFNGFSQPFANNPKEIRDLFLTERKDILIATFGNGIFHFNKQSGKFDTWLHHSADNDNSLCNDDCICFGEYDKNSMLIGTAKGLSLFDIGNNHFSNMHNSDGILSDVIHGISGDHFGNIFLSTTNGLYKIDSETKKYTHYTVEDGILDNQFYSKIEVLNDGRMLIGGLNGFIYFNPPDLHESFIPPDVQIVGYKIFDKKYQLDSTNEIHLTYDKNFITLEYSSLYYYSPTKINYYYKLDGVDKNWVDAREKKNAVYTDIDDGEYTFEVKCANNNGISSLHITRIILKISPPYYRSWWFTLLYISLLIYVCYRIYVYRLRSKRSLSLVRNRIAADLHDDIGSTLNSISVYSAIVSQQLESNEEQTKTILEKMGTSSRNMIDRMNDIVWAINPKNDDFEHIIQRMHFFAAELLSVKNILFQFDIDKNLQNLKLSMDKRKNFYLIYKEAINNAYKYSECKHVHVEISGKGNELLMIIKDDGKGFDIYVNTGKGNGILNMKERAAEIHAKIDISSTADKGTQVYFQMKV